MPNPSDDPTLSAITPLKRPTMLYDEHGQVWTVHSALIAPDGQRGSIVARADSANQPEKTATDV